MIYVMQVHSGMHHIDRHGYLKGWSDFWISRMRRVFKLHRSHFSLS